MMYILIPIIAVLMGLTVLSLVRGIAAFLNTTKEDLEQAGTGATKMQAMQNKMMFNRIKYQAAAIVVVMIMLAIGGGGR
ncbi:HIG1 domain-containing protein [Novosphingobium sp. Chol11]|uniref:HIG1 domain-containing protein n=1 Tax=Novosphingobium sp. Chol11 TaxID=1385763 RepID=UPI0025E5FF5C|nr:HIG1 domain-containing protein [Novosphingobium sp. Chol11]